MKTPKCKECGLRGGNCGRGLCIVCHRDPAILVRYANKNAAASKAIGDGEPTEEELDAMIAERYPTMPKDSASTKRERKVINERR